MRKSYLPYNREELLSRIDLINIELVGSQVITKYGDRVLSTTNVSKRYEIFDIKSYLKDKLSLIEQNFNIKKYNLTIKGGIQSLTLLSDEIDINGSIYSKSFFILNSSDKSRRLNFDAGLYAHTDNFYFISNIKNIGLTKKHLKGLSILAEEATKGLNDETFNEQVNLIKELVNHRVSLNQLRSVIVDNEDIKVNHNKFDAFKNSLLALDHNKRIKLTDVQYKLLRTPSDKWITI